MTEHIAIVPMMGCYPLSHMGHRRDIGAKLQELRIPSIIGLSSKNGIFTDDERLDIFKDQFSSVNFVTPMVVKSAGDTVAAAYNSGNLFETKILHIIVGADRKQFGLGLKKSIMGHKIPELQGAKFSGIVVHTAQERTEDFSGTALRQAVYDRDKHKVFDHLGPNIRDYVKDFVWDRLSDAAADGRLKLKRNV